MKVAVIGGGYLGSRIAAEMALCGCSVGIYDRSLQQRVVRSVQASIKELENKGHLPLPVAGGGAHSGPPATELASQAGLAALQRIRACQSLAEAAKDCNLLVEAIIDDLEPKVQVFREAAEHCADDCIMTTNSLSVPLEQIQQGLEGHWSQRVLGLRFLAPVVFIPLLEVTYDPDSQTEQMQHVVEMMEGLGKIVFDCPIMEQALRAGSGPTAGAPQSLGYSRLRLNATEAQHHQQREARRHFLRAQASSSTGAGMEPEALQEGDEDVVCVVCLTAPRAAMSVSCGHTVMCHACATKVKMMSSSCPICRMHMRDVVLRKQSSCIHPASEIEGETVVNTQQGATNDAGGDQ